MSCENAQQEEFDLIARAQHGDPDAVEAIIIPNRPLVYTLANRFLLSRPLTEELVQAGYLGMMLAIRHYDPKKGARLSTYAVSWILGEMKRTLRTCVQEACALSLEDVFSREGKPLAQILRSDEGPDIERIDLHLALESLPYSSRRIIALRYFMDRTQKEIAQNLSMSQAQISRLENRALDTLRARLRKEPSG